MQDLSDGLMKDLPAKFFEGIPKVETPFGQQFKDCRELREQLQKACDEVQPDRSKQGPVFSVGEVLEIRGGKFLVTRIEPGHLRLKSLPGYVATPK